MKRFVGKSSFLVIATIASMLAVGVATSSAAGFTATKYPTTLQGGVVGNHILTFSNRQYVCSTSPVFEQDITRPAYAIVPSAMTNGSCKTSGVINESATLEMNGCKFILYPGTTEPTSGKAELGPVGCGTMVLNGTTCDRTFKPQVMTGSPSYQNVGEGSNATVLVNLVGSMKYSQSLGCGGEGEFTGTYSGQWEVSGSQGGTQTGVRLSSINVEMQGGEQSQLIAGEYPVATSGEQNSGGGVHTLKVGPREIQCERARLGTETSGPAASFSAEAEYSGCWSMVLGIKMPTTISMNSCKYSVGVLPVEEAVSFPGTMGVACSKEGDAIEAKIYATEKKQQEGKPLCVEQLPAQAGVGGLTLQTVPGAIRAVYVKFAVNSLNYVPTPANVTCGEGGAASYSGSTSLYGF